MAARRTRRAVAAAALLLVGASVVVTVLVARDDDGTTSNAPRSAIAPIGRGYIWVGEPEVDFLQLSLTGRSGRGSLQVARTIGEPPEQETKVETRTVDLRVDRAGRVTATIDLSAPLFGEVRGNTLVLDVPQEDGSLSPVTFLRATADDYNRALEQLRLRVEQFNAAGTMPPPPQATPVPTGPCDESDLREALQFQAVGVSLPPDFEITHTACDSQSGTTYAGAQVLTDNQPVQYAVFEAAGDGWRLLVLSPDVYASGLPRVILSNLFPGAVGTGA